MNVSLTKDLSKFVADELVMGHYDSSEEIVIEGLQLLESNTVKLKELKNSLHQGKTSSLLSGEVAMNNIRKKLKENYGI